MVWKRVKFNYQLAVKALRYQMKKLIQNIKIIYINQKGIKQWLFLLDTIMIKVHLKTEVLWFKIIYFLQGSDHIKAISKSIVARNYESDF